ncbi:MAG: TetR family transcriptional regulator [Acidovorax sp.]|jgi:TetR/AcrR family acrAB operon transcriptional repressor|nr:TetR family transcriptional regulator [Acidovorax sp.]
MVRRTKEDAGATRAALLDAAEQVFYEQGVARASLSEIAQRAGATRGAVYWHFKDKLDLFFAMLERVALPLEREAYSDESAGVLMAGVARVRHVMALVFAQLERDAQTRRVFEILLNKVEYVGELLSVQERSLEARAAFEAKLAGYIAAAEREQSVRLQVPAEEAALALRCLFDGLIKSWLMSHSRFDLSGAGMRAVDAYLHGVGLRTQ